MSAVKSNNSLNAKIAQNFIIKVSEWMPSKQCYSKKYICSPNTLSKWLEDEKLKISLFKDALGSGVDVYTRKIRSKLRIEFRQK